MKISRLEFVALLLAAVFAAFAAGWFFRGQAAPQPVRVETERTLTQETPLALPAPTPSPSAQSKEDTLAGGAKINLNTAGVDELMTLPGIGEKRAEDIIAYRQANGPFRIPEELTEVRFSEYLCSNGVPDPDLVIRPSGEVRISNFLLWQSAYSEYYFTDVLWPDFKTTDLDAAIDNFNNRNRRFGGV